MIEKWKKCLDGEGGFAGAVLMDLSKAFDTINHELLIAKLGAYGFNDSALEIVLSYLSDRWQRTKVNTSFFVFFETTGTLVYLKASMQTTLNELSIFTLFTQLYSRYQIPYLHLNPNKNPVDPKITHHPSPSESSILYTPL